MKNQNSIALVGIPLMLSLSVVFPILTPGPILSLDNVTSPLQAIPIILDLSINGVLYQKLFLFLTCFIGIAGIMAATKKLHIAARCLSSLFWITNPFLIERLAIGQWHLILAVSLLPWLYIACLKSIRSKSWLSFCLVIILIGTTIYYYHRAVSFFQVIAIGAIIAWVSTSTNKDRFKRILIGCLLIFVVIVTSIIIGSFFGGTQAEMVSPDQLSLFSVGEGSITYRVAQALSYTGFWAERARRLPILFSSYYYVSTLVLLPLATYGLIELRKRHKFWGTFLISTYILAFLIVISNTDQVEPAKLFKIYDIFGFVGLRETGKFMGLMLVSQAIGIGVGTDLLIQKKTAADNLIVGTTILAIIIFIPANISLVNWGLKPSVLPSGLIKIAHKANIHNETVITFPWHRYQGYPFTKGKIVDQLGPSLFNSYIFNEMLEYNGILTNSPEDWQIKMADITSKDALNEQALLELLKIRNISMVVIFKTNDFGKFISWAENLKLTKIYSDNELDAYRLD